MSVFTLPVVITIKASNDWGDHSHTYNIVIYDCANEIHSIPAISPDVYVKLGDTETVSFDSSSSSFTPDSRCWPLTVSVQNYVVTSTTFNDVNPALVPNDWV